MGEIKDRGESVFRDFVTDGVPASGPNEPYKPDARILFDLIDVAVAAAQAGVSVVSSTSARDAFFATPANQGKLVYVNNNNGSATDAANGVYEYVSGAARLAQGFYQGLLPTFQPLVTQAQTAAAQAAASAATVVPQAVASTTSNASGGTVYTLNPGSVSLVDGSLFDFYVPAANLGPASVKLGSNTFGLYNISDGTLAPGDLPTLALVRVRYNQAGVRFNVLNVTANLAYTQNIGNDAYAARKWIEGVYSLPLALPVMGNPNVVAFDTTSRAAPADLETFEVIIAATNTGPVKLYAAGPNFRILSGGAELAAGALEGGTIANLTYSASGAAFVLNSTRSIIETPPPIGSQDDDLSNRPWGAVTDSGSGSAIAAITKNLVVIGSSNAASGYVADGSRPDQLATAALNDLYVGSGINFAADLRAEQGAPWSSASGQLQASSVFMAGSAKWVLCYFWMNDARSVFYHDNGGIQAQFNAMLGIIDYIRSMGAEPVISTGFHPDPRASPGSNNTTYPTKALDPFYFTDTAAYPVGGSTRSMVYPAGKASPVSPTADMVPAATDADFMVARDWSGGGVVRTGYKRLWHVNRTIREICAVKDVAVLDAEVSCFRNCNETVADLSSGLDTFYDRTNPVHPLAPMYQQGIKTPLIQWARHVVEGRNDRRVFTGIVS